MSTTRHVIFGTGPIGLAALDAIRRRGETARLVNRSGRIPQPRMSRSSPATLPIRPSPHMPHAVPK